MAPTAVFLVPAISLLLGTETYDLVQNTQEDEFNYWDSIAVDSTHQCATYCDQLYQRYGV